MIVRLHCRHQSRIVSQITGNATVGSGASWLFVNEKMETTGDLWITLLNDQLGGK